MIRAVIVEATCSWCGGRQMHKVHRYFLSHFGSAATVWWWSRMSSPSVWRSPSSAFARKQAMGRSPNWPKYNDTQFKIRTANKFDVPMWLRTNDLTSQYKRYHAYQRKTGSMLSLQSNGIYRPWYECDPTEPRSIPYTIHCSAMPLCRKVEWLLDNCETSRDKGQVTCSHSAMPTSAEFHTSQDAAERWRDTVRWCGRSPVGQAYTADRWQAFTKTDGVAITLQLRKSPIAFIIGSR